MADRAESADERALRRELQELAKKREVLDSSSRRSVLARLGGETTRAGGAGRHVQLKENNSRGNASWRLGKRDNEDNRQSSAVKRQRLHSAVARPEGSHDEERAEASRTSTSATSPSVDNARAQERKQRAVAPYAQKEGIARSRRMFGALMGHLGKAKRQIEKDTDLFKRQDTKQHEAEQREKMQSQNLENQARHEAEVARLQALIARTELDRSEQIARAKLEHLQLLRKSESQSKFLVTIASPPIYYLPSRHTKETKELVAASMEAHEAKMKASVQTHEEKLRKLEAEFATKLEKLREDLDALNEGDNEKDTAKASSAKKGRASDDEDMDHVSEEPEEDKKDGREVVTKCPMDHQKIRLWKLKTRTFLRKMGLLKQGGAMMERIMTTLTVNGASVAHSDTEASSPSRVKDDEKTVEQVKEESESPKQSNEAGVTKESATDDGSAKLESNDAKTEAPVEPKEDPAAHVDKMKVAELRAELKKRGLDTKGLKVILVQRLKQAMHGDDESK
ncbi:Pinin/SDK/MemA protein [Phytophthora cactorum]|nr:Pinin/SDK/MemA protein [Phytophthora cactorum]